MKKYFIYTLFLTAPMSAFCYQTTWVCNGFQVQNECTSLRARGCTIYSVTCENPWETVGNQRWTIVFEQN